MPYKLLDADKKEAPGPSVNGLREIKQLISENKGNRVALDQLLKHGYTNMLTSLRLECRNLANKTNDPDVKNSLNAIGQFASNANEIVALEM